jgi:hypothetical protein
MWMPPGGRLKRSGGPLRRGRAALAVGCALAAATVAIVAGATAAVASTEAAGATGPSAIPAPKPALSSNWAGYAIKRVHRVVRHFRRVTGTWVQPALTCTPGQRTNSAFWVGLGGLATTSRALEQTGTEADCDMRGRAHYSAWYELLPGGTVTVKLAIAPGDTIRASVAVARKRVKLTLRDLTSGASATEVRHAARVDTRSAEWIVEAPAECSGNGNDCRTLPLSDFGSITFTNASARLRSRRHGPIASPLWSARPIALSELTGPVPARHAGHRGRITATPTTLGPDGSSFTVSWGQR